jgi:hypothetical protein
MDVAASERTKQGKRAIIGYAAASYECRVKVLWSNFPRLLVVDMFSHRQPFR